ncbi:MAG: hypothetical protein AB7O96_19775 [Pseudobdellovibrionaceae bacterium]
MSQFQQSITTLHPAWQLWIKLLGMVNLILPLFFLKRREAWISIGTILVQGALMLFLFNLQGFTRLLGLAHFGWFGLIYYFFRRLKEHPARSPFGLWLRAVIITNSVSLLIDVTDVMRYLLGV